MARLHIEISDQLDFKFRDVVYKVKGMRKGSLTRAVEEAIELWIANQGKSS